MKSHSSTVFVCLALAAVLAVVLAFSARAAANAQPARAHAVVSDRTSRSEAIRTKYSSRPIVLQDGVLAFPPRSSAPSQLTVVYLHGIHGRAENGCPWLREGSSQIGWLVCPEANEHLANDTFSWAGSVSDQRAVIARAEQAAHAQGADPEAPGVIVGFSQGAYVALDLVHARLGRYRGLVLIAAEVEPSRADLAAAGIDRIVLAAGDLDASSAPLQRAAERLRREGVDARFVTLGRIGHSYETPNKDALRDAIAWAGGSA